MTVKDKIVGEWISSSKLYYRFDKNGKYIIGYYESEVLDSGTYTVTGSTLTIGDNMIRVKIVGNTLTLTNPDESVSTLTRL
jgi:hypothetical protein